VTAERVASLLERPVPLIAGALAWLSQAPVHRQPLFVAAAAIHAVLEPSTAFSLAGKQLMFDLADRERRRVQAVSSQVGLGSEGLGRLLSFGVTALDPGMRVPHRSGRQAPCR
jgi:hypothetical protein